MICSSVLLYKVELFRMCIFVKKNKFVAVFGAWECEGSHSTRVQGSHFTFIQPGNFDQKKRAIFITHHTPSLCRHTQIWQQRAGTSHWLHRSQRAERHTSHPGREKRKGKNILGWHQWGYFIANLF